MAKHKLTKTLNDLVAAYTIDDVLTELSRVCALRAEKPDADPLWERDAARLAAIVSVR